MAKDLKDLLEKDFADAVSSKKLVVVTNPVDSSGGKPKVGLHRDNTALIKFVWPTGMYVKVLLE